VIVVVAAMSWFGEALEGVRDAFDFVSGANDVVVVRCAPQPVALDLTPTQTLLAALVIGDH
jgi:hypothetical protein